MTPPVLWLAPLTCPRCAAPLTLDDKGTGTAAVECPSCEYADTWTLAEPAGGAR